MSSVEANSPERAWLESLAFFGIKLGLDNIEALLAADGDPHLQTRTVHVAGTNGKGSVLAFLDAMFQAAGYRSGRFTSPHLVDLSERFLVQGTPIGPDALDAQIRRFQAAATILPHPPTYFELCTAVAFRLFADAGVDVSLIETGMGGRLDSTNVVRPLATAITTIGFDHMQYLGNTLAAIAAEKGGIIKPGRPIVVGRVDEEAGDVLRARADSMDAPLQRLGHHFDARVSGPAWKPQLTFDSPTLELGPVPLGLAGYHQADNAAVACALAELLQPTYRKLTPEAMVAGLANARWPCRLERVCENPPIIIDAAHNAHGMSHYPALFKEAVVLFACSSDKDDAPMLDVLGKFAHPLILTQYDGPRSAPADTLAERAPAGSPVLPDLQSAIEHAIERASSSRPLLITGSIFLAGEARARLQQMGMAQPLSFASSSL